MWGHARQQDCGCSGAATMLIRAWVHSHTQNRVFREKDRQAETHSCTHTTAPQLCLYTHLLLCNHSLKMHFCSWSHTHTHTQQVQADSAQYLGGYSGEGGTLRDVFGYLKSLYPQGSKYQLLLGRTHGGVVGD